MVEQIEYPSVHCKAQETYNFHKIAAILADYGSTAFGSIMIGTAQTGFAVHIDGISDFKSQLKDAVSCAQKY